MKIIFSMRLMRILMTGAGHVEIVKRLVASGKVDVNATNGRGDTALHKVRDVQDKLQVTHFHWKFWKGGRLKSTRRLS